MSRSWVRVPEGPQKLNTMKVEVYESQSENSITVFPVDNESNKELLPEDAKLLREIEGLDWEDCMKKHHELMGWEPYAPFTA